MSLRSRLLSSACRRWVAPPVARSLSHWQRTSTIQAAGRCTAQRTITTANAAKQHVARPQHIPSTAPRRSFASHDNQGLIHSTITPAGKNTYDLKVNVYPASRRNELVEVNDHGIVIKLTTRSTDDSAANKQLCEYLADVLKVSKSDVKIKDGEDSSYKVVEVKVPEKVKQEDIENLLAQAFTSFPLGL